MTILLRVLLLSLCCVMLMAVVPSNLAVEEKALPYNYFYIGSWDEFATQHPYKFDTIEIVLICRQTAWHSYYTIRIIRSVRQLEEFLEPTFKLINYLKDNSEPYDYWLDKVESYKDRYDGEFFNNNDLVNVGFQAGLTRPKQLDVSIDRRGASTFKIIWAPQTDAFVPGILAYQSISSEIEKGLLDNMTSGQLFEVYLD